VIVNKEDLKKWCWANLQFSNNPKNIEDTFIIDILNGCNNACRTNDDKVITYQQIRQMFEEEE